MPEVLVAIWFASAAGGVIAMLVGVFGPPNRRPRSLAIATACFAVAGVLGILSIGTMFLLLSAACFVLSRRARESRASAAVHP